MSAFWGPWSYAYKHWLHRGCAERAGGATGEGHPALVREDIWKPSRSSRSSSE